MDAGWRWSSNDSLLLFKVDKWILSSLVDVVGPCFVCQGDEASGRKLNWIVPTSRFSRRWANMPGGLWFLFDYTKHKNRITPSLVGETKRGIISHQCSMEVVLGGHESLAGRRMVWRRIRKWSSSQIGVLFNRPIVVKHCHWVGGHLN